MAAYVHVGEQLILELYVQNIQASCAFYCGYGFHVMRDDGDFMLLAWDDAVLYLEEVAGTTPHERPVGNIRIMVANVDHYWHMAQAKGAPIIKAIDNRPYGLRDFTIAGPDGIGLRFATRLSDR